MCRQPSRWDRSSPSTRRITGSRSTTRTWRFRKPRIGSARCSNRAVRRRCSSSAPPPSVMAKSCASSTPRWAPASRRWASSLKACAAKRAAPAATEPRFSCRGVLSMRSHFARVSLVLSLTLGLGFVSAACGKYSINNLRATQAFQPANEQYKEAEWKSAIPEYPRAVTLNPHLGYAYFCLGNCYDNLYKPTTKGEPENDANLTKAVENYNLAINKLKN